MTIFFYKVCEPYGFFSNFSEHCIELEGQIWPSTEHYYQAQKFVGTSNEALCKRIHQAPSPSAAAALGRDPSYIVRSDWEAVKAGVMEKAVLQKFSTYPDLKQQLLATGDEEIIENSLTDRYWGCGEDKTGQNQLGKILMRVRWILRQQQSI